MQVQSFGCLLDCDRAVKTYYQDLMDSLCLAINKGEKRRSRIRALGLGTIGLLWHFVHFQPQMKVLFLLGTREGPGKQK